MNAQNKQTYLTLNNGVRMPQFRNIQTSGINASPRKSLINHKKRLPYSQNVGDIS